jgi:hypothetical protein
MLIRSLTEHGVFRELIRFSIERAGDQNAAAKALIFEYEEKPVATKKALLTILREACRSTRRQLKRVVWS